MESTCIIIVFGLFFFLSIVIMIHVNHRLLKAADMRLSKANDMVMTLAHSADTLSQSISALKDLNVEMQHEYKEGKRIYEGIISEKQQEFDRMYDAYVKLLKKYEINEQKREDLYNNFITRLNDLAGRPTINNSHSTTELK